MAIQPLPKSSTVQLSSGQVLLDPTSVVKELVDNAIDAQSKSIAIEISANTLNSIQVRDNGRGINPGDRSLVGQRFCTSKIRSMEDLANIGGTSMGFRGEALNSLITLAEKVEVTTRIEGEATAIKMRLTKGPGSAPRETASHPFGTTIKATNLFGNLPVRKQTAIKEASKTITKIHKMLRGYVFARPDIRFSCKIVKGKGKHQDFIYAPNLAAASVQDAAMKLFSRDCVSQCHTVVQQIDDFSFRAFIPKPNGMASKIGGQSQYVLIDSRPVSHSIGTLKQIYAIFKNKLKGYNKNFGNIKDPIFILDITCPHHTYDINVEPAKDDVMFLDATRVIEATEKFFSSVYPPTSVFEPVSEELDLPVAHINLLGGSQVIQSENAQSDDPIWASSDTVQSDNQPNFDITPKDHPICQLQGDFQSQVTPTTSGPSFHTDFRDGTSINGNLWNNTMYGLEEEDLPMIRTGAGDQAQEYFEELRQANHDIEASNPWVFAKMAAQSKRPHVAQLEPRSEAMSVPASIDVRRVDELPSMLHHQFEHLDIPSSSPPLSTWFGYSPSTLAHTSARPMRQASTGSGPAIAPNNPMATLLQPFRPPDHHSNTARYDLRETQRVSVIEDARNNTDIRNFFGCGRNQPAKQRQPHVARSMEDPDGTYEPGPVRAKKPGRDSKSRNPPLLPQSQINIHGPNPNSSQISNPSSKNQGHLPQSDHRDELVSPDIVNFFCSSQTSGPSQPMIHTATTDPRRMLQRTPSAALPLESIDSPARTHNLIQRMEVSPSYILRAIQKAPESWLPSLTCEAFAVPSVANVIRAHRDMHGKWAVEIESLLAKKFSDLEPAEHLRSVIEERLGVCESMGGEDLLLQI